MSTKLSLKEALALRGQTRGESREQSGSPGSFALQAVGDISLPVDVARLLVAYGISLKKAHSVLRRIAEGERVCLELRVDDIRDVQHKFKSLGVRATPIARPDISVAEIRHSLGLTQYEFAIRFAFEDGTLRNWEQGRNKPDPSALVLLAVIERWPQVVDEVLTPRGFVEPLRAQAFYAGTAKQARNHRGSATDLGD